MDRSYWYADDSQWVDPAATYERWVMTLIDPLISTRRRQSLERTLVTEIVADPGRAIVWFGGVLAEVVDSWPAADPWRGMDGTIWLRRGQAGASRAEVPLSITGARLAGRIFGDVADACDVVVPTGEDPDLDPGLVALAGRRLDPSAAALIAIACDGESAAVEAVEAVWASCTPSVPELVVQDVDERRRILWARAQRFLGVVGEAVRWALHRRRAHAGGVDDPWLREVAATHAGADTRADYRGSSLPVQARVVTGRERYL